MNKNSFLTKIIVLFFLLVSCKNSEQSSLNSNSQVFTPQDEELIIDEIKRYEEIGGSGQIAYAYGFYGFSEGVPNGKFLEIREKQADGSWPVSRLIWNELLQG